ncbi:hypothetical protein BZG36_02454 [Bifiguratus adelaidae]|uniref:Pyridoxamine 5'-phosphate oxidase Alr4036 family FMN-binding domain-containing protein n=1 Tax=Bifiguratus adelaidae TaxID=1938954 RepID=A0A261Y3P7_9FUNG|nr:hypothetical protein BZG36_02454 [Bifiguratus adelaidae]
MEWKLRLKETLGAVEAKKISTPPIYFATLDEHGLPQVRAVQCVGFVGERRSPERETGSEQRVEDPLEHLDPPQASWESALLCFSTDIRSAKCRELARTRLAQFCWWFPSEQRQFRIACETYIIASPESNSHIGTPTSELEALSQCFVHPPAKGTSERFSWDNECGYHFDRLPNIIRGWHVGPPPSAPCDDNTVPFDQLPLSRTSADHDLKLRQAQQNFALIVMKPKSVDFVDMAQQPPTRLLFESGEDDRSSSWRTIPLNP